jgi:hypothetical protein
VSSGAASARAEHPDGARVALLTNFIPPYRAPLFRLLARELAALRIFVSTPMEPNRAWLPEWDDLDVAVLPSLTLNRTEKHPHAFVNPIFVHLPYTALFQLWRFRPEVVVSGQLGLASLLSAIYCLLRRDAALVLWLTLSEVSELSRGWFRRRLRGWLLARADALMVNGESGAGYARGLGAADAKIFRVHQAVDNAAFAAPGERPAEATRRLVFLGSLAPRKGLEPFLAHLGRWAAAHPERSVELRVAGVESRQAAAPELPDNLRINWLGDVAYEHVPEVYADAGILAFPTLSDEWGLVVNEAMAAGVPVLGSVYSQAVAELVEDGRTGWTFRPDRADECLGAIERALTAPESELAAMRNACRERIRDFSFEAVSRRMLDAIAFARSQRGRSRG